MVGMTSSGYIEGFYRQVWFVKFISHVTNSYIIPKWAHRLFFEAKLAERQAIVVDLVE
jgi:hypothetical protein